MRAFLETQQLDMSREKIDGRTAGAIELGLVQKDAYELGALRDDQNRFPAGVTEDT